MKKKLLKSLALATIISANLAGITAFAAESGIFNYSGTNVYYSISKGSASGSNYNYSDANTSWAGKSGYVVTAYSEAIGYDGQRIGAGVFNSHETYASARKSAASVYAFNGSHTVASSDNVYLAKVTSWTNIPQ